VFLLGRVGRDLPGEEAVDADVADTVEGDEQHAANQYPRGEEEATAVARSSQQVIQSRQVDDEAGDVEDAETEHEDEALVVVVKRVGDLRCRVVLADLEAEGEGPTP
jgi:hypothetical protein